MTAPPAVSGPRQSLFSPTLAWAGSSSEHCRVPRGVVLAARNRDLFDVSAGFSPDRFMVAFPVVGAVLALRLRSNPTGLRGWIHIPSTGPFGGGTWVLSGVCLLLAAASLFVRYRRSAGEERLQLKWLLRGGIEPGPAGRAGAVRQHQQERGGGVRRHDSGRHRAGASGGHRHRHLEVPALRDRPDHLPDRLLRCRDGNGGWGLPRVYRPAHQGLPVRGSVGIAVAVLAAAALFNPLRRRVQAMVDQRFDRARYNAERVVAQFSVQVRTEVDLDVLGADLLGVVDHVPAPAHLGLWLSGTWTVRPRLL